MSENPFEQMMTAAAQNPEKSLVAQAPLSDDALALVEFIEDILKQGPVDKLEIWQNTAGGDLKIRELALTDVDPKDLAAKVSRIVDRTARGFMRQHHYRVALSCNGVQRGSHVMGKGDGPAGSAMAVRTPEHADIAGVTTQLMRHNEALNRTLLALTGYTVNQLIAMLHKAHARIDTLEARELEVIQAHARVTMQEADAAGIARRAEMRGAAESALIQQVIKFLPNIASAAYEKFTGKALVPSVLVQLGGFVDSLKPAQIEKIFEVFDDGQRATFGSLLANAELMKAPELPAPTSAADPAKIPVSP